MNHDIIEKSQKFVIQTFKEEFGEQFTYHNLDHTARVVEASSCLADTANLDDESREILIIASYFHDIGFYKNEKEHEKESAQIAKQFLLQNNYEETKVEKVVNCILATKLNWKGVDKLCLLLKDADLSGLSAEDYLEYNDRLRQELNFRYNNAITKNEWCKENIHFLQNHYYCTEEGKALFSKKKKKNLKKLIKMDSKKSDKKKKKEPELLTIGSSKSAQTQFKTALRNHIDLSAIADNKANIMLSVNAIIITVGLPLLIDKILDNNLLIYPTILLSLTSLTSMIFATLSTRPIPMSGVTKMEDIDNKKTNLFFFGNYYKMNFDEYERAAQKVVSNNEILDNSITRDLFFLGRSLGLKYDKLRWCYNTFMWGVGLTVLSFIVITVIQ